jgi:hypothetical protein
MRRAGEGSEKAIVPYSEFQEFYLALLTDARARGMIGAITSGMACVALGVAQTTNDCDVLCQPDTLVHLFETLNECSFRGQRASYRSSLSAPLEGAWLEGGWTSHFLWPVEETNAYLDVFGVPPHASRSWTLDIQGFYAGINTVAEMKRTDRPKDWAYATALGVRMLASEDRRGWLSVFDEQTMLELLDEFELPGEIILERPVLELARSRDARFRPALLAEVHFWQELDRLRLQIFQRAARPYAASVRASNEPTELRAQHALRLELAAAHLPQRPLQDYGITAFVEEARKRVEQLVRPELMDWLPDVKKFFTIETA